MPVKRRNHGRGRKNAGKKRPVHCMNCGRLTGKDKAVKRQIVRNIVDASSQRDIKDNRANEKYVMPKFYTKNHYCISCAIHQRVVRVRSAIKRKIRTPPERKILPQQQPQMQNVAKN